MTEDVMNMDILGRVETMRLCLQCSAETCHGETNRRDGILEHNVKLQESLWLKSRCVINLICLRHIVEVIRIMTQHCVNHISRHKRSCMSLAPKCWSSHHQSQSSHRSHPRTHPQPQSATHTPKPNACPSYHHPYSSYPPHHYPIHHPSSPPSSYYSSSSTPHVLPIHPTAHRPPCPSPGISSLQ